MIGIFAAELYKEGIKCIMSIDLSAKNATHAIRYR